MYPTDIRNRLTIMRTRTFAISARLILPLVVLPLSCRWLSCRLQGVTSWTPRTSPTQP